MDINLSIVLDEVKRLRACPDEQSLARLIGVAPSTLSHYRAGTRSLSMDRIDVIARLLDMDPYGLALFLKGKCEAVAA